MAFLPFDRMRQRLERDREDSDTSFWWSLLYFGELAAKSIAAGLIAGIGDDPDRLRYTQLYRLVRASGIGDWAQAVDDILTGPPAQFLVPEIQEAAEATRRRVA